MKKKYQQSRRSHLNAALRHLKEAGVDLSDVGAVVIGLDKELQKKKHDRAREELGGHLGVWDSAVLRGMEFSSWIDQHVAFHEVAGICCYEIELGFARAWKAMQFALDQPLTDAQCHAIAIHLKFTLKEPK